MYISLLLPLLMHVHGEHRPSFPRKKHFSLSVRLAVRVHRVSALLRVASARPLTHFFSVVGERGDETRAFDSLTQTSEQVGVPAEFKHIIKRRKRN